MDKFSMDALVLKGIVPRFLRLIARSDIVNVPSLSFIALVLALGANVAVAQVTLTLPDTVVNPSTSVSVPLRVTGFNHVGSFSLTITFDKTVLTYTGIGNQPASGSLFSTPPATANANGSVSISWFDPSRGLNIGSGTLLNLLFTYGNGSSALTFANITPSSITDSLATNIPASFTNGRVRSLGPPPNTPILSAPSNGAANQATFLTLSWNAPSGATGYRLQVSTDPSFGTAVVDDATLSSPSRVVSSLNNGTTYYWKVSASNSAGTSAFSTAWSFTTIVAAPAAPTLLSPVDNAINISLNPALTWNPLAEATSYELQVSPFSNFPDYVYDDTTSGSSRTIGPLNLGTTYYWRVRARNAGGFGLFSSARTFKTIFTSAVENLDGALPREFALSQNYPNPFNPTTSFEFQVASSSVKGGSASGGEFVTLKIFDVLGREVATLVNEVCPAGVYTVRWDASSLPSGVYFYRLQAGAFTALRTMMLMK
ncbi:MAG: cohesin domain-containing protein [Ignavibacteriales bacterium]|nr:cohesin domain-containing protein [Ignavibacteriales bacterium]